VSVGGGGRVAVGLWVGLGRGDGGWKGTYNRWPTRMVFELRQLAHLRSSTVTPSLWWSSNKVSPDWTI
jgi:hypothetical protein